MTDSSQPPTPPPVPSTPPAPDPALAVPPRKRPGWVIPVIVIGALVVLAAIGGGIAAAVLVAKGVTNAVTAGSQTFQPGAPDAIDQVADGYRLTSDSYDYSIVFPGQPTKQDSGTLPLTVQDLTVYQWADDSSVLVDESSYIAIATTATHSELEGVVSGFTKSGQFTIDNPAYTTFHGFDAVEGDLTASGVSGKFVAALDGQRLYTLLYLGDDTTGQAFFDSFTPTS